MGLPDQSSNVIVIGPNNATQPGGEATLDIEVSIQLKLYVINKN